MYMYTHHTQSPEPVSDRTALCLASSSVCSSALALCIFRIVAASCLHLEPRKSRCHSSFCFSLCLRLSFHRQRLHRQGTCSEALSPKSTWTCRVGPRPLPRRLAEQPSLPQEAGRRRRNVDIVSASWSARRCCRGIHHLINTQLPPLVRVNVTRLLLDKRTDAIPPPLTVLQSCVHTRVRVGGPQKTETQLPRCRQLGCADACSGSPAHL